MKALMGMMLACAVLTGCPPGAPPVDAPRQRLPSKPTNLSRIAVPGAEVISAPTFSVFVLRGALDKEALRSQVKQCSSNSLCGDAVAPPKVAATYEGLEKSRWTLAVLGDRLVAVSGAPAITEVFVHPDDREVVADAIMAGGIRGIVLCSPGAQPQCPPPPIPPRDEFLISIIERRLVLPNGPR